VVHRKDGKNGDQKDSEGEKGEVDWKGPEEKGSQDNLALTGSLKMAERGQG